MRADDGQNIEPCPFCGVRLVEWEHFSGIGYKSFGHPPREGNGRGCIINNVRLIVSGAPVDVERLARWNRRPAEARATNALQLITALQDGYQGEDRGRMSGYHVAGNMAREALGIPPKEWAEPDASGLKAMFDAVEPAGDIDQITATNAFPAWRDIATAPANTDVLVYWPIVKLDDDGDPTDEIVGGAVLISEDQGGYWIEPEVMNALGDHMGDEETYAEHPSLWMPKPAGPGEATPAPVPHVVGSCPTCEGTGKEGRHSICRDCDEAQPPTKLAGWKLVPTEPTDFMIASAIGCDWRRGDETIRNIWRAMLKDAPPPQPRERGDG